MVEGAIKKARSPSYPGLGLEMAVEKAGGIHANAGRSAVPSDTAMQLMGYSGKSGPGAVALAALKKYGLLEDDGTGRNRRVKLSPLALSILLDDIPGSPDRLTALQEAALSPGIFFDLWHEYDGKLPDDRVLRVFLTRDRNFTSGGANDLIRHFRSTVDYAQLDKRSSVSPQKPEEPRRGSHKVIAQTRAVPNEQSPGQRFLEVPLPGGGVATLTTSRPLSPEEWNMLTGIIKVTEQSFIKRSEGEQAGDFLPDPPDESLSD